MKYGPNFGKGSWTPTKEEHDAMMAERDRPLTDDPIGTWTQAKRETDAINSRLVGEEGDEIDRSELLDKLVKERTNPRPTEGAT